MLQCIRLIPTKYGVLTFKRITDQGCQNLCNVETIKELVGSWMKNIVIKNIETNLSKPLTIYTTYMYALLYQRTTDGEYFMETAVEQNKNELKKILP